LSGIFRQNEPKLNPLILLGNGILMTYTATLLSLAQGAKEKPERMGRGSQAGGSTIFSLMVIGQ
jgi:hypothetical protein